MELIARLEEIAVASPGEIGMLAFAHLGVGIVDSAISLLERAVELRNIFVLDLVREPGFAPLHDEPRFQALLKAIGLRE